MIAILEFSEFFLNHVVIFTEGRTYIVPNYYIGTVVVSCARSHIEKGYSMVYVSMVTACCSAT
jgi:hypothetical protein